MKTFISYSSKSREVVDALSIDLEALGYVVWFDRQLSGGQDWWAEILSGIRFCDLFIFALTPQALESQACKLEYEYALALNKRILPIMLQDINIGLLASSLQMLQVIDYRQQNKPQALALGKALNNLPKTRPLPKPLPPLPDMRISPITRLSEQISAPSLKGDEQRLIVTKLRDFLTDDTTAPDARRLLKRFRHRDDLLAGIEREIVSLLGPRRAKTAESRDTAQTFIGQREAVFCVAYSPSGRTILSGGVDETIRLWDTQTGEEIRRFVGHRGTVWNVAYSPNSRLILSGSRDKTARLWDTATGREVTHLAGHTDSVWGVAYAPDGKTVLTGSFDKTARLWDPTTGKEVRRFEGHTGAVWAVAYSPDGHKVATCSWDKSTRIWDISTGKELRQFVNHKGPLVSVAWSPDGHTILSAERDNPATLWDVTTGQEIHRLEQHIAFSTAFSPDGSTVLTGGGDKTVRLWNTQTGHELRQFIGHADAVTCVAFSPDGSTALSGSADKTVRLWNINKPARSRRG